jgi:hypothetical protein
MQGTFGLSGRRECELVGLDRSTCRYQVRRAEWPALRERLRALPAERRRLAIAGSTSCSDGRATA